MGGARGSAAALARIHAEAQHHGGRGREKPAPLAVGAPIVDLEAAAAIPSGGSGARRWRGGHGGRSGRSGG